MDSSALQDTNRVCVKTEPCEDVCIPDEATFEGVYVKPEPLLCVKNEPRCEGVWIKAEPSCSDVCVKELLGGTAAARLCADDAVKDEPVLAPELIERRDMRQAPTGQTPKKKQTQKSYECPHCGYESAIKLCLDRHLSRHTNEKPYRCNHCSYASSRKDALVVHIRKHTGEKPYKCEQCSFATAHKSTLQLHARGHRMNISGKPYKCDRSDVQTHKMVDTSDTGGILYKCNHCTYASGRKVNVQTHARIHRNGEQEPYKMLHLYYQGGKP
ncbi:zinc finger protein 37 homolog [Cydia fagiglandana]|uniref:zinc finger protein 37 homolog n=1 Tax=Cydia fagiglandana TaxID=1458189 RepID=UPI002FEE1F99